MTRATNLIVSPVGTVHWKCRWHLIYLCQYDTAEWGASVFPLDSRKENTRESGDRIPNHAKPNPNNTLFLSLRQFNTKHGFPEHKIRNDFSKRGFRQGTVA
jgi:hypothetical protein